MKIESGEFEQRILWIREKSRREGLDAFLVTSGDNLYYLTGKSCMPFERPFVLVIPVNGEATFMVPRLEMEHLQAIKHINRFATYYEYPAPESDSWYTVLGSLVSGMKKLGTDLYTWSEIFSFLSKKAETECYDWLYSRRFTKSSAELELLKEASRYIKPSMVDFIRNVRCGSLVLDTLEPAKKTQKRVLLDRGFDVDFYAMSFLSGGWPGAQSARPHSIPNPADSFNTGPNVMIMSYRIDGYAVELERTFFTRKPDSLMKERFGHMLQAREIAFSLLKPGTACSLVDQRVREYLIGKGYEKNIIHRTGHGMGVSNHEGPFLAIGSDTILEQGMVLTVEPGIYFDGHGAYRHSDTVVITDTGYECLTDVPTDLESLTSLKKAGMRSRIKKALLKKMMKKP